MSGKSQNSGPGWIRERASQSHPLVSIVPLRRGDTTVSSLRSSHSACIETLGRQAVLPLLAFSHIGRSSASDTREATVSAIRKSRRWDLLNTTALLRTPGQGLSALQVLQEVWVPQTAAGITPSWRTWAPRFLSCCSSHVSHPGHGYESLHYPGLSALWNSSRDQACRVFPLVLHSFSLPGLHLPCSHHPALLRLSLFSSAVRQPTGHLLLLRFGLLSPHLVFS